MHATTHYSVIDRVAQQGGVGVAEAGHRPPAPAARPHGADRPPDRRRQQVRRRQGHAGRADRDEAAPARPPPRAAASRHRRQDRRHRAAARAHAQDLGAAGPRRRALRRRRDNEARPPRLRWHARRQPERHLRGDDARLRRLGLAAPSRDATLAIVGLSLPEAFAVLAAGARRGHARRSLSSAIAIGLPRAAARSGTARAAVRAACARRSRRSAARDDIVLGIATGNRGAGVDRAVRARGLGEPLPHRADGRRPSLQAASRRCCMRPWRRPASTPERTVMVGDTTFDMEMARAAGVGALGVAWGYHSIDELRDGRRARRGRGVRQPDLPPIDALLRGAGAARRDRAATRSRASADEGPGQGGAARRRCRSGSTQKCRRSRGGRPGGFAILLDGRPVRTPKKLPLRRSRRARWPRPSRPNGRRRASASTPPPCRCRSSPSPRIDGVAQQHGRGGRRHRQASPAAICSATAPRPRARSPTCRRCLGSDPALGRGRRSARASSWPRA